MNKFQRLQLLGTTMIFLPILVFGGAFAIYKTSSTTTEVVEVKMVAETKPKIDTVIVVKEEVKKVSEPVIKKPIVVPTPPAPIVPKIEEIKKEKKDSIVIENKVEVDTTGQV